MAERRWAYVEPAGPVRNPADPDAPITTVLTESQILAEYWPWWQRRMVQVAQHRPVEISEAACLDDWVIVHWAWPVRDVEPEGGS